MRILACLALLCAAAPIRAETAEHGRVVVHVVGVRGAVGTVRVKVHHHGRDFPASDEVIAREKQAANGETARFEFPALPHGSYAVVVLHDEDDDASLDRGLLGRPEEGLGFSNGARVRFGPPSFEEAAFELRQERLELSIELEY